MTPAQLHISLDEQLSAGTLPTITVGTPGTHGANVIGIQGMGVNTPSAAAVAAATVGLAKLLHMPKGITFSMGLLSRMLAAGTPADITKEVGKTARLEGAAPKLHCSNAPWQTCIPMISAPSPIVRGCETALHQRPEAWLFLSPLHRSA